jgi:hypothetical protein
VHARLFGLLEIPLVIACTSIPFLTAYAGCPVAPFVPPRPSPYYCVTGSGANPEEVTSCRQAAYQFHMQEQEQARREWERQQAACEAQRQQRELRRQEAEQRAAEEAARQRAAAENARHIAEQREKEAAAKVDLERKENEGLRLEAERQRLLASISSSQPERPLPWYKHPAPFGPTGVISIFLVLVISALKEWMSSRIPRNGKIIALLASGMIELAVFLVLGINLADPLVLDFIKFNGIPGVTVAVGVVVHHATA